MGPTLPRSNSANSALTEEQLNQMRNAEVQKANAALQNIQNEAAKNPEAFKEALLQLNEEYGTWSAEDVQKYVQEVNPNLVTSLIVPGDSLSETQYQERIENAIERTLHKRKIVHHTNPGAAGKLYLGMKKAHEAKQMLKEGKSADYKKTQREARDLWGEAHRIAPDMGKTLGSLGRGAFGSAESVASKEGGPVVVKKTLSEEAFQENTEELKHEYAYLRSLNHPNIIKALYSSPEEKHTMLLESGGAPLSLLFNGKDTEEFKIEGLSEAISNKHGRILKPKILQQMRVAQIVLNAISTKTSVDYDGLLEEAQQIYDNTSFSRQDIDKILSDINNMLEITKDSQAVKFLEDLQKKCSVWKLQIAQKLHSEGPLPMQNVQHIGRQVVEGLAYLHQTGVVHLDIKADNVLIQPDGTVKIIDFGMSKLVDDYQRSPSFCGTPSYMAPEIINLKFNDDRFPQGCSEAVDVYSAGCLLCQLTTGSYYFTPTQKDFRGSMGERMVTTTVNQKSLQQKVNDNIAERYPDDQNAEKAEQLKDLLAKMLEPFPEKRISMQNALEHPFFQ